MDINKIVSNFKQALDDHHYDGQYSEDVIYDIVETSLERKSELIELFRKHPNWDEDQLCIHFDRDIDRKTDSSAVSTFFRWLNNEAFRQWEKPVLTKKRNEAVLRGEYLYSLAEEEQWELNPMKRIIHKYTTDESYYGGGASLKDIFDWLPQETILPEFTSDDSWYEKCLSWLNELDEKFNFRPGMKINRVINKICVKMGLDKLEGYNAAFAQFSDGITPLKINRHTTISVNPVDFLLMSNGNSWHSCHYIGNYPDEAGCYSSGTISYMMGEDSFIVSVIDKEWPNDNLAFAPKINRQVFGYRDYQLLQSRLYPQVNDNGASETYRNLREMVEEIIANAEGEVNRWVKSESKNVLHNGTAYPDWSHFSVCGQYELREKVDRNEKKSIRLDNQPVCISCGGHHWEEEGLFCDNCQHENVTCEDCGCIIDIDDEDNYVQDDDGCYYCRDCRFFCQHCVSLERTRNRVWISDIEEEWCEYCADRDAFCCDKCGEYHTFDDCVEVEEEFGTVYVCSDCAEWCTEECADCGERHYKRDMVEYNGKWYCESCAEEHKADEEESA